MQSLMARAVCLSHEAWGKLMTKVMCNAETKEMLDFFRVNPLAMTKFKAYLAGLYTCSSTGGGLPEWFMDELQRHWFCSVRSGAMSDPTFVELIHKNMHVFDDYPPFSIFDIVGKIVPLEDGWLGSCYSLNEDYTYVSWLYPRRSNPLTPRCLSKLHVYNGLLTYEL